LQSAALTIQPPCLKKIRLSIEYQGTKPQFPKLIS